MKLILSGEGATDIGKTVPVPGGTEFVPGPMAEIVDWLVQLRLGFSPLELNEAGADCLVHRSEGVLANADVPKRPALLPGVVRPKGEAGTTAHAYALGSLAKDTSLQHQEPVVAVLFRDTDGTRSAARDIWQGKVAAIHQGFQLAGFQTGVAMVPRPKSEAWMLCALKPNGYQHCEALEDSPGNDRSPNALKAQLATLVKTDDLNGEVQAQWVRDGLVDPTRIDMPSFNAFRSELEAALLAASA